MPHRLPADISQTELRDLAAGLLSTKAALVDLTVSDAWEITRYMRPARFKQGAMLIHQGEVENNDFLMLVIEGEATVELEVGGAHDEDVVLTVIGPGGIIGAMGALDGDARSASAVASTDMVVAVISREAVRQLMEDEPALASRFLMAVSKRLFDRLREVTRQIRSYIQVNRALMAQLREADGDVPGLPATPAPAPAESAP